MDPGVTRLQVIRSLTAVERMLEEGRLADAVSLLYFMHKDHILEWVYVKRELLAKAVDGKKLLTVAAVLDASKKSTLAESARTIPGLSNCFHENPIQELLD
jgi:hypothetical protein